MNNEYKNYKVKHGAPPAGRRGRHEAPPVRKVREPVAEVQNEEAAVCRMPVQRRDSEKRALRQSMPFFVTLALVTVLAWLIPLRPTVAEGEKRELAHFPEFSMEALLEGDYFAGIDTWFSDTFTGRNTWMQVNQTLESMHGMNDVVMQGNIGQQDSIPVLPSASDDTMKDDGENPDDDASVPTTTPASTPEPTEKPWGGDSVGEGESLNRLENLMIIGDTAYEYPGFIRDAGEQYSAAITRAGQLLDGKCRVFSLIAPFGASVMLSRDFRENELGCTIEEDVLTYLEGLMTGPNVYPVRVIDRLIEHNSEYIFFRTDHHWTALGAYYAYTAWCDAAGVSAVPLSRYEEFDQGEYLGTYYEGAENADALAANPDQCIAYVPPGDISLYVTDYSEDTPEYFGEEMPLIFDETEAPLGFKYFGFLVGDHAFNALINDSIQDDSAVLVYKNSMGNPFVYYLTQHYHSVYVCDYRYYETRTMTEFVDLFGVDDVIFVNNTSQAEWYDSVDLVESCIGW